MKKLLLILLITAISCSKDEINDCGCTKYVYESETYIYFNDVGLPVTGVTQNLLSTEDAGCTDQVSGVYVNDTVYYNIECIKN